MDKTSIENDAHRKASAKNSSKLNKFLHSEVNLLIQHIIMQDQDGENNNKNKYNFIMMKHSYGLNHIVHDEHNKDVN